MSEILKITSPIQHYEWGGTTLIRDLLGIASNEPCAELWMGTHDRGCSSIHGTEKQLQEHIVETQACSKTTLPFLFKVLDAHNMLSIQLHPNKDAAQRGFEREEAAGIALTAFERNYRDNNAKPELHCALTPFWMVWGIRPSSELKEVLTSELYSSVLGVHYGALVAEHEDEDQVIRLALRHILSAPQTALQAGVVWLQKQWEQDPPVDDKTHDYWMNKAIEQFCDQNIDPGLFVMPLMNLVKLTPGQGTYQPAGVPHAYLRGATMELMENSDNVLRAGLTRKHIDTEELLKNIDTSARDPRIIDGVEFGDNSKVYETPESNLRLSSHCLTGSEKWKATACTIGIVIEGELSIVQDESTVRLNKGEQFFAPRNSKAMFNGTACTFYTATTT